MKIFLWEIVIFSKFSERKKSILMKMNPPGSFSAEGTKKISKRGSSWGVTPLEKLGKAKKKTCQGGSQIKWTSEGKNKIFQRGSGFKKIVEPLAEERKIKA